MHAVAEARSIMRIAVPPLPFEGKMAWLARAAGVFSLTFSQAKKIEYGEVKDLRASRLDAMREKFDQRQERAAARRERNDATKQRLADIRSACGSRDPGSHSGGTGATDERSLGAGEGSNGESGRPAAVARPHEE